MREGDISLLFIFVLEILMYGDRPHVGPVTDVGRMSGNVTVASESFLPGNLCRIKTVVRMPKTCVD